MLSNSESQEEKCRREQQVSLNGFAGTILGMCFGVFATVGLSHRYPKKFGILPFLLSGATGMMIDDVRIKAFCFQQTAIQSLPSRWEEEQQK
jgi:hypothetical protein